MIKHIEWSTEETKALFDLIDEHPEWSYQKYADRLTEQFRRQISSESVRKKIKREKNKPSQKNTEEAVDYKETTEINKDGTQSSHKLLRMSFEESKDVNYLLKAHGYDIDAWELISARNNIWNTYSKQDGISTLYASRITVKPRKESFDWDDFIKKIQNVPTVDIERAAPIHEDRYLNIPLFDMHFGISDYAHYKETQSRVINILKKGYKDTLIIVGSDLFHNDDMRGRTSSGREIEKVDMVKAWRDATLFYEPVIKQALESSENVKIMFSKGNHSESMEWAFVQYLKARFPQCKFDDEFKERKVHMLGLNLIGVNHGDKKHEQNLTENFATEFPIPWSKAKTRTVFTGHRHSERVIDKGGVVIRRMPTRNKVDDWHDDQGYTTAHSRFQIHEFNRSQELAIYYV